MARNQSAATITNTTEEVAPEYTVTITPEEYRDREYYAARDAVHDRAGILRGLRGALRNATGRSVTINIIINDK